MNTMRITKGRQGLHYIGRVGARAVVISYGPGGAWNWALVDCAGVILDGRAPSFLAAARAGLRALRKVGA